MNSSLLQIQSEIQENNILNLSFHSFEENSLFHYNDEESNNNIFFKNEIPDDYNLFQSQMNPIGKSTLLSQNNDNLLSVFEKEEKEELKNNANNQLNSVNYFNDECTQNLNFSPKSLLTTSTSNIFYNAGVKKNENEEISDKIFKCDFLESISLGLDENDYSNINTNKKKNKIDLNNPTSLLAAIINLMKEKGPIETKTIISCLESKKDTFRKANGSRYKQDFSKLIRTTLNTPDIFYKIDENKDNDKSRGCKYFFIEDKTAYYLQKKRERDKDKMLSNLRKKNTFLKRL